MEKYRTIAEAVLILGLVIVGGIALDTEKGFYCKSRGIAANCDRTTATRCYHDDTYNVCKEGWKLLSDLVEINNSSTETNINIKANSGLYNCETNNGEVSSYTKCIKENNQEAYLGELI